MDNENLVKRGYLQLATPSNGFFHFKHKKQWSKKYFALFKKSSSGIQRLEMFSNEKSYLKSNNLQKIIPLNNCFRVIQMSQKGQPNVFEIHTKESVYYLSTESYFEMSKWLRCLQNVAFDLDSGTEQSETKNSSIELKANTNYENQSKIAEKLETNEIVSSKTDTKANKNSKQTPKSEENILYCSVEQKPNKFRVTVGQTEAAIRCSLHIYSSSKSNDPSLVKLNELDKELSIKYYYLVFNSVSVVLVEDLNKPSIYLYEWKFNCIRRYGCTNDSFTIEVGRKSKSGAGLFLFYTQEASTIFNLLAKSLNDHVNELKNDSLNNNNLSIKELELSKCKSINTLINIQPTKYDSNMSSPSSNASNSSIKSNFTSSIKSSSTLSSKSSNSPSSFNSTLDDLVSKEHLNESSPLPVAQSVSLQIKKSKTDTINEEKKDNKNEIKVSYNPFLSNHVNGNLNKVNNLIKTTNVINLNDENDYNDVDLMMESKMNLSNCKLSSCSIANLNERLHSLNKSYFKSLPQINKIGINCGTNDPLRLTNDLNFKENCKEEKLALQPNVLMKPPRMNKAAVNDVVKIDNKFNEIELKIDNAMDVNRTDRIKSEIVEVKDEEPIFESRLELFGYDAKEENHYEVADDLDQVESFKDKQDPNNLIPIDTYELLVSTLNKIDEKSLNTLKKAIKKVLTDNASVKGVVDKNYDDNVQNEFVGVKNLIIDKTNQETTINYIHNDCEYAKILPIMKKKFVKKTIVEQF